MTEDPWYRKMIKSRNPTLLLRGVAIMLLIFYKRLFGFRWLISGKAEAASA